MNKIKKLAQEVGVISLSITIVFVLVMGVSMVKGWTEPTAPAPGGNVGAPINVGSIGQIKEGNMVINSAGTYTTGLTVNKDLDVTNGAIDVINGAIHSTGDICTDVEGGKCLGDALTSVKSSTAMMGYCSNRNGNAAHQECGQAVDALPFALIAGNPISPARCTFDRHCACEAGYSKVWTGMCGMGSCAGLENEVYNYSCIKNNP